MKEALLITPYIATCVSNPHVRYLHVSPIFDDKLIQFPNVIAFCILESCSEVSRDSLSAPVAVLTYIVVQYSPCLLYE